MDFIGLIALVLIILDHWRRDQIGVVPHILLFLLLRASLSVELVGILLVDKDLGLILDGPFAFFHLVEVDIGEPLLGLLRNQLHPLRLRHRISNIDLALHEGFLLVLLYVHELHLFVVRSYLQRVEVGLGFLRPLIHLNLELVSLAVVGLEGRAEDLLELLLELLHLRLLLHLLLLRSVILVEGTLAVGGVDFVAEASLHSEMHLALHLGVHLVLTHLSDLVHLRHLRHLVLLSHLGVVLLDELVDEHEVLMDGVSVGEWVGLRPIVPLDGPHHHTIVSVLGSFLFFFEGAPVVEVFVLFLLFVQLQGVHLLVFFLGELLDGLWGLRGLRPGLPQLGRVLLGRRRELVDEVGAPLQRLLHPRGRHLWILLDLLVGPCPEHLAGLPQLVQRNVHELSIRR